MTDLIETIGQIGIVPVVTIEDPSRATAVANALVAGGLPLAEVTFRTSRAVDALRLIADTVPDLAVGAGTVLTPAQVDEAVTAGAKFIVAPGLSQPVVERGLDHGVTVFPGICTPTELEAAMSLGCRVVKFFPAEAMGGLATLKALSAPYQTVRFMPTGGISPENLRDYLEFPPVLACGGGWMVSSKLIDEGAYSTVEQLARDAAAMVGTARQ